MTPKSGDTVYIYHRVRTSDGEEIECSFGKPSPFRFTIDSGRVLRGLNDAVKGLEPGEQATVVIPAVHAHGEYDSGKLRTFRRTTFYQGLEVGQVVTFQGDIGQPIKCRVLREEEDGYVLDMNHPLAGKDLVLEVELVDVAEEKLVAPFI